MPRRPASDAPPPPADGSADGRADAEERLRLVLSAGRMGMWEGDMVTGTVTWSEGMWDLTGLPPGEPPGDLAGWAALIHPDDRAGALARFRRGLERGSDDEYHDAYRLLRPDGSVVWVGTRAHVFRDAAGRPLRVLGVNVDVTAQREAEIDAREREAQFRATFENAAVGIAHVAPDGRWLRVNDRLCALLGYPREELQHLTFADVTHPDDRDRDLARAAQLLEGDGETYSMEKRYIRRDGTVVHVGLTVSLVHTPDGAPDYFLSVVEDATERHAAAEALRRSEAAARRAFEELAATYASAPVGLCVLDRELRFVRINERLAEMNGLPMTSHLGRTVREVLPGLADEVEPVFRRVLETGEPVLEIEVTGETVAQPGVARMWVENVLPLRDSAGAVVGINVVTVEVTEQRAAEAALRTREAELRVALDAAGMGTWRWDLATDAVEADAVDRALWGFPPDRPLTAEDYFRQIYPDDAADVRAVIDQALASGGDYHAEHRIICATRGNVCWLAVQGHVECDDAGHPQRVVAVSYEVTERKEAEAALRERETRYRTFLALSQEGIWRIEVEEPIPTSLPVAEQIARMYQYTWLAECNDAFARMYGYERPEEIVGARLGDLLDPADPANDAYLSAFIASGYRLSGAESHEVDRDGNPRVIENALTGEIEDGALVRAWGTQRDVTERKAAEAALAESEARFRALADAAPVLIWTAGPDAGRDYVNAGWLAFTGRTMADEVGEGWMAGVHPEDRDRTLAAYARAFARREALEVEYRLRRYDGVYRWLLDRGTPRRGPEGEVVGFAGSCVDIHERKEVERVLEERVAERTAALGAAVERVQASEERFRSLFRSTPIGVAVTDPTGQLIEANPALHDMLGYAPGALRGVPAVEIVHPDDRALAAEGLGDVFAGHRLVAQVDLRLLRADGEAVWTQTTTSVARDVDGTPRYAVGSITDVTERRRLEQAAEEASETERRRLSYELHDDLVQRLAGASVLAHTLAEGLRDEGHTGAAGAIRVGGLVRDAMSHARALSRALAPVDLLAEGLAEALGRLGENTEDAYGVRCRAEVGRGARVDDPAVATNLFRIAQEAVSNAARHAGATEIAVRLARARGRLVLTVADDGKGLPPGAFGSSSGLGLRTMRARAAALGGTLTIESPATGGTVVTCSVPAPAARPKG